MNNKDETTPNARLKLVRQRLFDTARAAADAWGIPPTTYYNLEQEGAHKRAITPARAKHLAAKTGGIVTAEWLLFGTGCGPATEYVSKTACRISLWSPSDISALIGIADGCYPLSEKMIVIESDEPLAERRISLLSVPDRAMVRDKTPSYEEGARVFVEPLPEGDYQPEDVVAAVIAGRDEAVIREYTRVRKPGGGTSVILKAYNPAFEDIEFNPEAGDKLVGVVVGSLTLRSRHR